jgi:hypothetical protein
MPRYYFDVQQNSHIELDATGFIIPPGQDVGQHALRIMTEVLLSAPSGRRHSISIGVRDERGAQIYSGNLVYRSGDPVRSNPFVG